MYVVPREVQRSVWFYFDFLNAMKILGVNLIFNTIAFNLDNFLKNLSFLRMLVGN
jgi:hypothetical protein